MTDQNAAGAPAPTPVPALPSFLKGVVEILAQHSLTAFGMYLLATHQIASQAQADQLASALAPAIVILFGVAWSTLMQRRWFTRLVTAFNTAPPLVPLIDAILPRRAPTSLQSTVTMRLDASELIAEIRALADKIDASAQPTSASLGVSVGQTPATAPVAEPETPPPEV